MNKNQVRVLIAPLFFASLFFTNDQTILAETVVQSKGANLTVYNQNFALVKDLREIELKEGLNYLNFEDVAAKIDPTSVSFQSITAPNAVIVKEQNYQYDLLDPNTILAKSIGKNIKFRQYLPGGIVKELSGELLSTNQGLVVKTDSGIVLHPSGEIELSELPTGLVSKPTLLWKLDCKKAGKHLSEIRYQTNDMNWHCDYIAVVNEENTKADLSSWVTLDNRSGASFKNASLKLMAGDMHRVQTPQPMFAKAAMAGYAEGAPQFQEEAFSEYQLYSLKDKADVNNNETKQLSLLQADDVPVKKCFVFESNQLFRPYNTESQKIKVKIEVENSTANHLGMPLPKGKVRVYQKDKDGSLQFVGEDEINHTPRDEKIRVYIGDAFDIVGEHKQINIQQVSNHLRRTSYQIILRNHKNTDVTIAAIEHAYGDWRILSSSLPYEKTDSTTFEFAVKVPANGENIFNYEIETKF